MLDADRVAIITHNQDALDSLKRALRLGQGQFSLILARANYRRLRRILLDSLIQQPGIQEVALATEVTALRETLQQAIAEPPSALMVTGLEHVQDLPSLLRAANLGRDAFPKTLTCPVVFWVSDRVLQLLNLHAPDLKSFAAAPIRFEYPPEALTAALHQAADTLFASILDASEERLGHPPLYLPALTPELQTLIRYELPFALTDLGHQQIEIDPDLRASLHFLQGREAHTPERLQTARECYEHSLAYWSVVDSAEALDKQAVLLLHLGLWWRSHAALQRLTSVAACQQARGYLERCLDIFRQQQRPDRTGRFLHVLAEVLQKLNDWEALATVAQEGLVLHQGDLARLARDYGYLAEVALANHDWAIAQASAEQALTQAQQALRQVAQETLELGESLTPQAVAVALRYQQGWYHFLLGQAQLQQGQADAALSALESARRQTGPRYDLPLYRKILETLQSLYFDRQEYLTAFQLKLEQRRVESLFGLRAFIGASQIQPYPQSTYLDQTDKTPLGAEIRASGRQKHVAALVDRLVQPRYPLVIVHGQSGVGKSSILSAGLVPALRQVTPEGRVMIPVLVQSYRNCYGLITQALETALVVEQSARHSTDDLYSATTGLDLSVAKPDTISSADLMAKFRYCTQARYQQIVLILDQFEEFFFERPEIAQRLEFYQFLKDCLNTPYVKVVMALREDYLHFLLEWDRLTPLEIIDRDILSQEVRYYLGNFSLTEAEILIRQLTESAQFYLEDALVMALVKDLAGSTGEVRPIELQMVGAELQRQNITTLQQYLQLGAEPKETLVQKFLDQVLRDCGPENIDLARAALYLLSDESGTRPLKSRLELEEELTLGEFLPTPAQLDLVLKILVGSGIIFELPEVGGVRYQLVHDYLGDLIQQQQETLGLIQTLQAERQRRRFTEEQLRQALQDQARALEHANQERHRAEQAEIRALVSVSQARLLSHDQLGALLAAVKGARNLIRTSASHDLSVRMVLSLWQAVHSIHERNRLEGHRDWVLTARFSPDGQRLASAGDDHTVRLWSLQGELLQTLRGHRGSVLAVAFSADGEWLASASDDRTINLWSAAGHLTRTLKGHDGAVHSLAFNPATGILASAGNDHQVRFWDCAGQLIKTLEGHDDWVRSVSFSPDGQWLVSASEDGTVRLWDAAGRLQRKLLGHKGWVLQAVFSPDGQLIASGGDDHTVRLWNRDGRLLHTLDRHQDWVRSVCFSPDGQMLASASDDRTIKLWSLTGELLQNWRGHQGGVLSIDISADGSQIVSASDDDTVRLWAITGQRPALCEGHRGIVWDVCWQPQGDRLISGGADDTLKLWQADGRLLRTLTGHQRSVHGVACSPDGELIASASADHTVRLWTAAGEPLKILKAHQNAVWAVAFSPDSQYLASAGTDRSLRLWRRDGTLVKSFQGHQGAVWSVAFSPDGQHLVSASEDSTVRLWHVDQGLVREFSGHSGGVWDAVFSPDGRLIGSAGGDSAVRLWAFEGKAERVLRGHRDWVRSLCFSPNGHWLASASDDTTVRLWDLSGQLLQTLEGHTGMVWKVAFDHQGDQLASASADGTVRLWNLCLADLLKQGCAWLQDYLQYSTTLEPEDRLICSAGLYNETLAPDQS
jgi:WD40 repeat protein